VAARSVRFHPEAERDLEEGLRFYLSRSAIAGERFLADVWSALTLLQEAPVRWPVFRLDARRFVMAAFPYSIIYRVRGDEIQVLAMAHAKRRPGYWLRRRLQ
jgi:toxin ParE1/3/4